MKSNFNVFYSRYQRVLAETSNMTYEMRFIPRADETPKYRTIPVGA